MKKFTKLLGIVLILALVMSISVSAFAGTIEVNNAFAGETYHAYKLLEYTSNKTTTTDEETQEETTVAATAFSYYLLDADYQALGTALEAAGFEFTQSADGTQWFVSNSSALDESQGPSIAKKLYESLNSLDSWKDDALDSAVATGSADGKAKFTDLATGYWFVTSSVGSLCTLQSFDDEELVVEKNTMITDAKIVDDDSKSLQIGDTATYTITLTDGKGTNLEATLTDTMSAGLTYNNDATVKANGVDLVEGVDDDYTVSVTGGNGEETVVVYTFSADVMATLEENQKIVVTYTATLNQYASLDGTETNTEITSYSEQETQGNTVDVKSYNLTIQKKANSVNGESLKGAQFALYRDDETDALSFVKITGPAAQATGNDTTGNDTTGNAASDTAYYRVAVAGETGATTVIDMTDAHTAVIYGLDGDSTYHIEETKAPDGYNKLQGRVDVAMGNANQIQPVVNNAGSVLPSTGGIGTTIFYVVGSVLVIAAGVLLVTKKRMGRD